MKVTTLKQAWELTRQYPHGSYRYNIGKQFIIEQHAQKTGQRSYNWDVLLPWVRVQLGYDPY